MIMLWFTLWRAPWAHGFDSFGMELNWKVQYRCHQVCSSWDQFRPGWRKTSSNVYCKDRRFSEPTALQVCSHWSLIPANANIAFVTTCLDLSNSSPSFHVYNYRCGFEKLWALPRALWTEQVRCAQSVQGSSVIDQGIFWWFEGTEEWLDDQHLFLFHVQCYLEMLEQRRKRFSGILRSFANVSGRTKEIMCGKCQDLEVSNLPFSVFYKANNRHPGFLTQGQPWC